MLLVDLLAIAMTCPVKPSISMTRLLQKKSAKGVNTTCVTCLQQRTNIFNLTQLAILVWDRLWFSYMKTGSPLSPRVECESSAQAWWHAWTIVEMITWEQNEMGSMNVWKNGCSYPLLGLISLKMCFNVCVLCYLSHTDKTHLNEPAQNNQLTQ